MVPYAGRVRDGHFDFDGVGYTLPLSLPPHAIHGTAWDAAWTRLDDHSVTIALAEPWPFGGLAHQRFVLDDKSLRMELTVSNDDRPMPAMLGWHPWFRRTLADGGPAATLDFEAQGMFVLDENEIPTGEVTTPTPGPWDNCFAELQRNPVIGWGDELSIELTSSCDFWVVYTEPFHAFCVEPQSSAPDAFNRTGPTGAHIVAPGQPLSGWYELRWTQREGVNP